MKKTSRIICALIFILMLSAMLNAVAFAHSGRTDGSGGHRDNKNKSGLGSYHYHCGGYPPHLHTNGCPYGSGASSSSGSSSSSSGTSVPKEVTATAVTIDVSTDHLYLGGSFDASATISPSDVEDTTITWTSSDESVAEVTEDGTVKAVGFGTARIIASASNGVSGSFYVTVKEKVVEDIDIPDENMELIIGDKSMLSAQITPVDATYPEITWTSSDETVLTVSEYGGVTTVSCGTATVTATSSNGLTDSVEITVKEIIAENISIVGEESLKIGSQMQLDVTYEPEDTTFKEIDWSSDDEAVLTISNSGCVTAKSVGSATITAVQKDATDTLTITVEPIHVTSISIDVDMPEKVCPGDILEFDAIVSPDDATYPEVTWTSGDEQVATIDETGKFEAKKLGSVSITATADGITEIYEVKIVMSDTTKAAIGISAAVGMGGIGFVISKKKKRTS